MERYYGEKPEMAWVDINKLDIDNAYQRNTNGTRSKENIKKIMSNFCWEEFTPITVVKTEKGIRVRGFHLTDAEWEKVKEFIRKIREKDNE